MKLKLPLCVLFALVFSTAGVAESAQNEKVSGLENAVILIIRHAEEADTGDGLSPAGEARAQACAGYFKNFAINGQPAKLGHIFATRDTKNSHRPRLTVEPTARKLGLTIDDRFKDRQFLDLVNDIESQPHGENILISWHHGKIPQLLRALGADPQTHLPNGKWPDGSFGWLIQLRYDQNGHLIESKRVDACPLLGKQN
jgi:broad specificity phosphatase PhoE